MEEKKQESLLFMKIGFVLAVIVFVLTIVISVHSVMNVINAPEEESEAGSKATVMPEIRTKSPERISIAELKPARDATSRRGGIAGGADEKPAYSDPDYEFKANLADHLKQQNDMLRVESESRDNPEDLPVQQAGKRSLALSREEIEALEKSGNMIH